VSDDAELDLTVIEENLAAIREGAAERAKTIQPGQCPGCGSYRLDGRPPLLHEHGCPWKDDAPFWYRPDGSPFPR
jgi:hypothetical protein